MKQIIILCLILMSNFAHCAPKIHGVIKKNRVFFAFYLPATDKQIPFEFPRSSYHLRGIDLTYLVYGKYVDLKHRKYDLNHYTNMWVEGKLDLVSYDENDNFITFRLTPFFHSLVGYSTSHNFKPISIDKVNIKFSNGDKSCLIHGRYLPGDHPRFIMARSPDDCPFIIEKISKFQEIITLKSTNETTMLVELYR